MAGNVHDVFPYEAQKRFEARRAARPPPTPARRRRRSDPYAPHPPTDRSPRSTAMADAIVIVSAPARRSAGLSATSAASPPTSRLERHPGRVERAGITGDASTRC
jgi:hypothetical protein